MFPAADIPVVQLAVQSQMCAHHHLALGRALAALPAQGVLILASGHMTHNLRAFFHGDARSREAAHAFRDWTHERILARELDALVDWESRAPHARAAHPTPEHFLPLFVALGAAGNDYTATPFVSGYTGDVLAMDAYRFEPA
jgi:4,5-DOPA dioxygenase extradiol